MDPVRGGGAWCLIHFSMKYSSARACEDVRLTVGGRAWLAVTGRNASCVPLGTSASDEGPRGTGATRVPTEKGTEPCGPWDGVRGCSFSLCLSHTCALTHTHARTHAHTCSRCPLPSCVSSLTPLPAGTLSRMPLAPVTWHTGPRIRTCISITAPLCRDP